MVEQIQNITDLITISEIIRKVSIGITGDILNVKIAAFNLIMIATTNK